MSTEANTDTQQVFLTLAAVVRPQGRRGEVLADLQTDFPEQFAAGRAFSLLFPDGSRRPVTTEDFWLPKGRSEGRVVLKFAGTDSISDAERLAGAKVQIPQEERVALDAETYYVNDLIGCTLADGEHDLGIVEDMHFPTDASGRRLPDAAALFVVQRANGDEVMIPFANAFIRRVSIPEKRIEMSLPHGLVEMNG